MVISVDKSKNEIFKRKNIFMYMYSCLTEDWIQTNHGDTVIKHVGHKSCANVLRAQITLNY